VKFWRKNNRKKARLWRPGCNNQLSEQKMDTNLPPSPQAESEALALAKLGYKIIPVYGRKTGGGCECGNIRCEAPAKHPPLKHWQAVATTDRDTITGWFRRWSNYGVICDKVFAVDIDDRNGGGVTWGGLTAGRNISRSIPHTWISITGGGGRHIIFKQPDKAVETKTGILKGIDVKGGASSYIVGAGSVHACGRRYKWAPQASPHDLLEPAEAPMWILELAPRGKPRRSLKEWRELTAKKHRDGTRTNAICAIAGHLLANPLADPLVILELMRGYNEGRCVPPLEDERIIEIVNDFAGKALLRSNSNG
jgi:hypothetical protein